jgi:hypothetical protein
MPKVIQLEFNELCPSLMDRFIGEGHLPNFARLRQQSLVYVTDAEERAPNLEPWIQWVTAHTGLSFAQHGVFDLGDGHKLNTPRIWDLVGERGGKVWICGSMNASFRKPITGFILPDPWSVGIDPYPEGEFEEFFHFVRSNVQEHTRDKLSASRAQKLRFISFMVSHGMSSATAMTIGRQLLKEKGGKNRWRRAIILDRLQWDVFSWYWNRHHPEFSTFFLNSTAHFQHMYWRNMDPAQFQVKPAESEQEEYANAVRYGYEQMDVIVGKCLDLVDADTTIVLASALGQQPCLKYEDTGGKTFYRPVEPAELFEFAGLGKNWTYAPVMAEQFHIYFPTEAEAIEAAAKLGALDCGGRKFMLIRRTGNEVFSGCSIFEKVQSDATVTSASGETKPFFDLFYHVGLIKSGMHHPDGIFWIRTPELRHVVHEEPIPLRQVAPTVLTLLNCPKPAFMEMEELAAVR